MQAVYAAKVGGDTPLANLAVGEMPDPAALAGEARVRVTAAALNHHDLWTLRGVSSRKLIPPVVLGCDAAGVVEAYKGDPPQGAPAVGSRVVVHAVMSCGSCAACAAGDTLHCPHIGLLSEQPHPGTMAEWLCVPAGNLIALPDSVDDEAAACLPTAYLTAYRMLFNRAALAPGSSVLVQGASGGVATAVILLAKAAGITVYATSRDQAKRNAAELLGAVEAFAPDRDSIKALVARTGGGVDAVIETVGEPTWDLSLRAVRPGGAVVVSGATGGPNPPAQLNRIFWRHITVAGSSMGTLTELRHLVEMCAQGFRPLIDSSRPLAEAADAFADLEAGRQRGKLVLTV